MKTEHVLKDKRIVYAGLATILIVIITLFSQSMNQIVWIGLSAGLQQIGSVLTLGNLTNLGNTILMTVVSALGWHIGFTIILYVAFLALGITLIVLYRRAMKATGEQARWFDYLFMVTTGVMCVLPLIILVMSVGFFSFYTITTLQAFNNLSAVSIEPLLATWEMLVDLLANFTFTRENIEALFTLIPQISTAIGNFGDVVTIWNQTVSFVSQLDGINTTLELSKFIGVSLIIISDAGMIYMVVKALPNSPLPTLQIVPKPTPAVPTEEVE
ncbi:MAG: hypothetical protein ACRC3A_00695 [Culicoidibacterales bacterium]